ncbi:uncharacterized protein [Molothrus aeneus]|uniref:uncharacterized protein isoform X2 n=1 Tax=Molothrus aeneus TaxID=84833 RepID=UPI00345740C2
MGPTAPLPALAVVTALLAATAMAQGPSGPLEVALSGEGPTPEPPGPAKMEASGESDLSTSAHLGKAVTSAAFPGSPLGTEGRDPPPGGASGSESGSESAPPPPPAAQRGPLSDVPSQSSESEEGDSAVSPRCDSAVSPLSPR